MFVIFLINIKISTVKIKVKIIFERKTEKQNDVIVYNFVVYNV